ncbi:MAG: alpha/beta hydrolase [Acidobacteria bacterium]|nr:alpha/beta hydrolase [Acidobacteriota bacterium]
MAWSFDPPGRIVEAGRSRVHMRVSGEGSPVVVLEAGVGATSLSWALVEPALAARTTVVSYDRAGLGWSGPVVTPRTPGVVAEELRLGLGAMAVRGPFILVGHSFGGLVVRRFASLYPDETAGVVLVDALEASEFWPLGDQRRMMIERGVRLCRRGATLARLGVVGASLRILLAGNRLLPKVAARMTSGAGGAGLTDRLAGEIRKLPRELWPVIAWHWSQAKNFEGLAAHLEMLPASCREAREGDWDSPAPVTAIVADRRPMKDAPAGWRVERAEHSGHWVQLDRPELVVAEVLAMVRAAG